MSEKQTEIIPVGNKGTVVINPAPQTVIDLSNGSQGLKEDSYNAGGSAGGAHRGAPKSQTDGNMKKRRKKKKKGRTSSGSY